MLEGYDMQYVSPLVLVGRFHELKTCLRTVELTNECKTW